MAPTRSFEFTEVHVGGFRLLRPIVPVNLRGPTRRTEAFVLLDSGADHSMIDLGLAKRLGLDLSTRGRVLGVSGGVTVFLSSVGVEVLHPGGSLPAVDVPVWVPARPGLPPEPVLGREVFFQRHDVEFQMGHGKKGRFAISLRPAR